ncbi:MAG: endolytic transglycosylase MltG [bacterium]
MDYKIWIEKLRHYFSEFTSEKKKAMIAFSFAFVLSIVVVFIFSAPSDFPIGSTLTIHSGESLQSISINLKDSHIVKSTFLFRSLVILFGGEKKVIAGDYLLDQKENVLVLAERLVAGQFRINAVKVTIPEGWTVSQIGDYLEKNLTNFNKAEFLSLAKPREGYLFPDTYFLPPSYGAKEIIQMMNQNFEQKVSQLAEVKKSGKSLSDIITMASILEDEVLPADRQTVSGILWKRISIGMPLQVDSSFLYINGKNTYNLTLADLKIDSPYNTYTHKGLPPGPIGNPGVNAIIAAATPVTSDYLYYLTEKNGTIHYAKTFEEHKRNKAKYLK